MSDPKRLQDRFCGRVGVMVPQWEGKPCDECGHDHTPKEPSESKRLSPDELEEIRRKNRFGIGEEVISADTVRAKLLSHISAIEADHRAAHLLRGEAMAALKDETFSTCVKLVDMEAERDAALKGRDGEAMMRGQAERERDIAITGQSAALTRVRELEAAECDYCGFSSTEVANIPQLRKERDEAIQQRNELIRWVTTDATHHPGCLIMRALPTQRYPSAISPVCTCGLHEMRETARSYLSTDTPEASDEQ